jgi:hypothetical protein
VKHQEGLIDIIKSSYITDCVTSGELLKLSPKYIIHATSATESTFMRMVDRFQDSYTEDVDVKELKKLMESMPVPPILSISVWRPGRALDCRIELKKRMASLSYRYFHEVPGHLFTGLVFYIMSEEIVIVEDDLFLLLPTRNSNVIRESSASSALDINRSSRYLALAIRLGGGIVVDCLTTKTTHVVCNGIASSSQISQLMAKYRELRLDMSRLVSEKWVFDCIAEGTLLAE